MTIPELIAQNKDPYYKALEAADDGESEQRLDVSEMEHLLSDLLARQMVLALQRGESPGIEAQHAIERAKNQLTKKDINSSRPSKALQSRFAMLFGSICGGVALLFFMALLVMSMIGYPVPPDARYLVVIVLALAGSLSAGFLGGNASARGSLPLPLANDHPLAVAFTGGIAVLVALLILGHYLFP